LGILYLINHNNNAKNNNGENN
jgi:hypothetical protein